MTNTLTQLPGCYIGMNREPGVPAALETVHECGGNDWTCPVGVDLELALGEAEDAPEDDQVSDLYHAYAGTFADAETATLDALRALGWDLDDAIDAVRRVTLFTA